MTRIVSLLPSATDLVGALGLADWLVGVSHECDWPPEVTRLPRLTRSLVSGSLPPEQMDLLVNRSIHQHRSLYELDAELLRQLAPDVILTQELCDVCAVSYDQVLGAARLVRPDGESPAILSLEPATLDEVIQTAEVVANVLDEPARGQDLLADLRRSVAELRERGTGIGPKATVLVLEWPSPPWLAGHWVPDMVAVAGGKNVPQQMMRRGAASIRVSWQEIAANDPDLIIVAPCGYDRAAAAAAIGELESQPAWTALRAVRNGAIYPVEANRFWSRPGPRLLDGIAELQAILLAG